MAFTLNSGEFDLGAGFIGRGTILAGETYVSGTSTTGVQGLINTSGLEGLAYYTVGGSGNYAYAVAFRASDDSLTGSITAPSTSSNTTAWLGFNGNGNLSLLDDQARLNIPHLMGGAYTNPTIVYYAAVNSSSTTSEVYVNVSESANNTNIEGYYSPFRSSSNWRFLARNHPTALTHYPSTLEKGIVFAASCVNSTTQWGLWIAGEVGDRSGYFNQTQGYFAIVLLVNGSDTYFSAFSPSAANSTSRNDAPFRHFNIVPAAGQSTTDDKMSELLILRDLGSFESAYIGKVPGFFYIDPNKAGFDSYEIGDAIDINPVTNAVFEGRDRALVVGRWGADQALTASNTGAVFTITSASPNRRTLENGRRIQFTTIAPTGMAINTNYWVINWNTTAFTFNLATIEGGSTITPSSNATGITITAKAALLAMRCQ